MSHTVDRLSARALLFQALSICFGEPAALERHIAAGRLQAALDNALPQHEAASRLRPAALRLRQATAQLAARETEAPTPAEEHALLFHRRVPVPLTETSYGIELTFARTRELADIGAYHAAFGFELAPDAGETPDHLAVQLEFVALLCFKEACALANGLLEEAAICREARASYLTEHLTGWFDVFKARLSKHARLPFYPAAADLAGEAVALEHASVGGGTPTMLFRDLLEMAASDDQPLSCGACPVAAGEPTRGELGTDAP